ncbi:cytochrome c oxidase assembly protein COX14 homolog [Chanodichthys erythropterus]|uniref:cytochrome c oxidase assembly protein COX14 homolog n=1 Tax=Chanodichthys erythropterus TaxID=933992 RepID=UPI00351E614D
MLSGKRIADVGYKIFSGSMMLLTVYGGFLCVMRAQRYMQKRKQLELAAQNESTASDAIKE